MIYHDYTLDQRHGERRATAAPRITPMMRLDAAAAAVGYTCMIVFAAAALGLPILKFLGAI